MRWLPLVAAVACSHAAPKPSVSEAAVDVTIDVPDGDTPARADHELAQALARGFAEERGVVHTSSTTDAHHVHVVAWIAADADLHDVTRRINGRTQGLTDRTAMLVSRARGTDLRVIVRADRTPAVELRAWVDKDLRPRLESVPGVTATEACGGERRRLDVVVDLARLSAHGAGIDDLAQALRTPPPAVPAGAIAAGGQTFAVRSLGYASSDELTGIVVQTAEGAFPLADAARFEERGVPDDCDDAVPRAIAVDVYLERGTDDDRARRAIEHTVAQVPNGITIAVEPAPARFDVALTGGGHDGADARAIAAVWRRALIESAGVRTEEPVVNEVPDWTIDRPAAAAAGVDVDTIRGAIATLGEGTEVTTLDRANDHVDVYLRAGDDPSHVPVRGTWQTVPLTQLAHAGATVPGRIDRLDLAPGAIVRFTVAGGDQADATAADAIARARAAAPPGDVHVTSWREP